MSLVGQIGESSGLPNLINNQVAHFSVEYDSLLAEKMARYEEYKAMRKEMMDYHTTNNNIDKILGLIKLNPHAMKLSCASSGMQPYNLCSSQRSSRID